MKQISIFDIPLTDHPLYHHEINQYYLAHKVGENIGIIGKTLLDRFGDKLLEYTKELHAYLVKESPIIDYYQWHNFPDKREIGVGKIIIDEIFNVSYFHVFLTDSVIPVRVYSEIPTEFWIGGL